LRLGSPPLKQRDRINKGKGKGDYAPFFRLRMIPYTTAAAPMVARIGNTSKAGIKGPCGHAVPAGTNVPSGHLNVDVSCTTVKGIAVEVVGDPA